MAIQENGNAPYAPGVTIWNVIERARERGLPSPVTKDVLLRAGVTESLAPRTLQALQLLDLINEDGTWTENLQTLRRAPTEEFQARFAEILRSVYAEVFQYVDPSQDSPDRVRDAFRRYAPHGQQERMVTLFLSLCERAGIVAPTQNGARATPRETRLRPPPTRTVARGPQKSMKAAGGGAPLHHTSSVAAPLAGLLSTLPAQEKGWTQADRDRFVKAFETILDYCIPIRTREELAAEESQ